MCLNVMRRSSKLTCVFVSNKKVGVYEVNLYKMFLVANPISPATEAKLQVVAITVIIRSRCNT